MSDPRDTSGMTDSGLYLRNVAQLVTCDAQNQILTDVDVLIANGRIQSIQPANPASNGRKAGAPVLELDARQWVVYPGLINTHHHFFQAFVRNRLDLSWPCDVMQWISRIYPIFARLTEPCFYHTAIVCMAELIKHGCTTAFDHQYCFPEHAGSFLIDQQFHAADKLGMRFVAGRGTNTLGLEQGGNVPAELVESDDQFMHDLERLTKSFHQTDAGAMRQIVAAPCQPMNCSENTFIEAAAFAREHGLQLHTHMGEGESAAMLARYGKRSLAWLEDIGFVGDDVWVAHAWDVEPTEISRLAATQTGVSHCPLPVMLVGEAVTDVSAMLSAGVRVGLGVDGCASNDASNLAECIRLAFLLQCLVATERGYPAPDPRDYLQAATQGGASLLGRSDLGMLQPGACADLFVVRQDKLEHTGAWHAPESLPAKLGLASDVHLTMIDGRIVWRDNQFPGYDEAQLAAAAHAQFSELMMN